MIYLKDINKAIVTQVTEFLANNEKYGNIPFSSTDIVEEIKRPCFYVDFLDNKTNLVLASSKERNIKVQLFYYPKDILKSKLELLEMQELLENIFLKHLKIDEEFFINIKSCNFNVNKKDGYLILNLELYTLEEVPEEDGDMMEELSIIYKQER